MSKSDLGKMLAPRLSMTSVEEGCLSGGAEGELDNVSGTSQPVLPVYWAEEYFIRVL